MIRAIVLACGNSLRGDDGIAPYIANCLRKDLQDSETLVYSYQQWTPELAEPISKAGLVIFLDASGNLSPGKIACCSVSPVSNAPGSLTHQTSPAGLLALAELLYGTRPARAYLLTIGGVSFDVSEELSEPVRRAVPGVIEQIKTLLAGTASASPSPS